MSVDLRSGKRVASGEFLLDEDRAREKLGQFQLVDRRFYVLEFVKAARLMGASRVEFRVTAHETLMWFDGLPLRPEEIEQLATAAFRARRGAREDGLRHLAIGASAAQSIGLSEFTVGIEEDWGGPPFELAPGRRIIRVYLRKRSPFLHTLSRWLGEPGEEEALKRYCVHASIPIVVNGERVSQGHVLLGEVIAPVAVDEAGVRGMVGLNSRLQPHGAVEVTLVQHGVTLSRRSYQMELVGAVAVLEADILTTNLSQSAFVEDEAWFYVHHQVIAGAIVKALGIWLASLTPEYVATHHMSLRRLVAAASARSAHLQVFSRKDGVKAFIEAAQGLKIYRVANEEGQSGKTGHELRALEEFRLQNAARGEEHLYVSRIEAAGMRFAGDARVLLIDGTLGETHLVLRAFAERVIDVTDILEDLLAARKNRKRWEERAPRGALNLGSPSLRARVSELDVEVGFSPIRWEPAQIFVVKDERLLKTTELDDIRFSGLRVQISGPIVVNRRFDGPCHDSHYTEAALEALELIAKLYHEPTLNQGMPAEDVPLDWFMDSTTRRDSAQVLATALGVEMSAFDAWWNGIRLANESHWLSRRERASGRGTGSDQGSYAGIVSMDDAMAALDAIAEAERTLADVERFAPERPYQGLFIGSGLETSEPASVLAPLGEMPERSSDAMVTEPSPEDRLVAEIQSRVLAAGWTRGQLQLDCRDLAPHEICRVVASYGGPQPSTVVALNRGHCVVVAALEKGKGGMDEAFVASAVISHLLADRRRQDPELWRSRGALLSAVLSPRVRSAQTERTG